MVLLRPISAALMAMVRARSMPNAHIGVTGKFFSAKTGCSGSRVRDGAARWRNLPSAPFIVASLTKRSAYIGANCCLLMSAGWSASAPSSKSCPNLFHGLGSEIRAPCRAAICWRQLLAIPPVRQPTALSRAVHVSRSCRRKVVAIGGILRFKVLAQGINQLLASAGVRFSTCSSMPRPSRTYDS